MSAPESEAIDQARLQNTIAQQRATISDTGIGMLPEIQERIFEKFYRAREARDVEAQGLGLGLSLVQELVHAHGGRIEVQSAPGEGSTFRVVLPRGDVVAGEGSP